MLTIKTSGRQVRRAGDAARDRRDWAGAERHYREHLDKVPDAAAIWVQLGHAIREQGRYREAAEAYQSATRLLPDDADAWIHLAHTARLADDDMTSRGAFERGFALTGERGLYEEVVKAGGTVGAKQTRSSKAATFLLIDDLLKFLADHTTLSGIQRVQVGLIESLLGDERTNYQFITGHHIQARSGATFWVVPREVVRDLVDYAVVGTAMVRERIDRLLDDARQLSRRIDFIPGDIVFLPGAFWIVEKTGETLAAMKRAGAKVGVYVYDLIPITHPEYCHEMLVELFARAFTEMMQFVDFFATISEYVADVLRAFIADNGLRPIPVTALPLAHFLTITDQQQPPSQAFADMVRARLRGRPYAIYVSTLEGRKNHLYVLNVWRELMRQGVEMPELVFLGRKGWRSEGLFEFLESTKNLYGKVHIFHDVSDGDLAYLYRNCAFSLFTSFVEGWGLPVGESLVFGRPCVASACCSIPEVGGDLVDYVDPLNLRDGQAVIGRMATDTAYHAERVRRIATEFRPRPWSEVATRLTRLIDEARARPQVPAPDFRIPVGVNYDFRGRLLNVNDLSELLAYPSRILLGDDFYGQEMFGAWMRGTSGSITLPTTCAEGDALLVAVEIKVPGFVSTARVSLAAGSTPRDEMEGVAVPLYGRGDALVVLVTPATVGADGMLAVRLDVFDAIPFVSATDKRDFYIGISSVAFVAADAPAARTTLLSTFAEACEFVPGAGAAVPRFAHLPAPLAG